MEWDRMRFWVGDHGRKGYKRDIYWLVFLSVLGLLLFSFTLSAEAAKVEVCLS